MGVRLTLVQLHRDPITEGVHVLALPMWVPPARQLGSSYWHIPRSANLKADGRVSVHFWCGPFRYYQADELNLTAVPPSELRCGTCVGRRNGYDRINGTIFRPRDHWELPSVCPSTTPDPDDLRRCVACGRPTNAARGWTAYGLARHAPDAALAERFAPCPRHGWRDMQIRDGTLACCAWGCRRGW